MSGACFSCTRSMTGQSTRSESERVGWQVWAGFSAMCVGMFMAILDIQIVATSLPAIRDALKVSPDQMSWIQTSYLIAEVIAIPLTGFLSRAFSVRRLFLGALSIFTLASIGCAYSPDFATLIGFRVIQGLAGGCPIPLVFSSVFLMFPVQQQGIATTIGGVLAAWILGLWWLAWDAPVNLFWLAVFVVLQCSRIWVLATLGERWTTKIIVLPGAEPIRTGPFRFVNHPNYCVVIGEIAVLPLTFGLVWFAVLFSILNAAVLFIRIRAENEALSAAAAETSPAPGQ